MADLYVCADCGCRECQVTAWVDVNTGRDVGDEGPTSQVWCPDCEIDHAELVTLAEYEDRKDRDRIPA